MKRLQVVLLLGIVLAWATPAQAQWIFSKKPRPNASQRVPELILTLKTDLDERKRLQAVEELRDYDASTFTEIAPVLADVLRNDPKMSVRLEALNNLARIRPVHPLAVPAIEKAAHDDESWRVRWQAKTSLPKLQLTGLMTKKGDPGSKKSTGNEPPLDNIPLPPNTIVVEPFPMPAGPTIAPAPMSPSPGSSIPRPLPRSVNPASTTPPPANPTPAPPIGQGPALFP